MNDNNKSNQENEIYSGNDLEISVSSIECDPCATVTAQDESITEQSPITPNVIDSGEVVVKVPVVLAETNITIPVEAIITLDQIAMEIKRIKKNVFLTQSRLIPFSGDNKPGTAILFIAGFVRKNIEYATQTCHTDKTGNVCGEIRHCTVNVPFNFTTRITFLKKPIFTENTTPSELEFFTDKFKGCDACADPMLGRNSCDQSLFTIEYFNEKPFVELVKAKVVEIDIHTNPTSSCLNPEEQLFTKLTEKLVLNLTLKILQNQQVKVKAV